MIALLVDGDEELLDLLVLGCGGEMHHIGIARGVEVAGVTVLIEVDEVVGVDGLQLCLRRIADVVMRMVPLAKPMPPVILKLAFTPSFTVMLAAALSSTLLAVCAIETVLISAARIRKQIFFILPLFKITK